MCEFSDHIRGCRCNEKKIGAIRELNMSWPPAFSFIKEAGRNRILGKSLKSKRRNEFNCILGHDDENVMSLFDEQTSQLSSFVSGNRTGDAEDNAFPRARLGFGRSRHENRLGWN